MQLRSLHSMGRRALAAGAASALALTLFNAAQPTLGSRPVQPGTVKDVAIIPSPAGAVDNRAHAFRVGYPPEWGPAASRVGGGHARSRVGRVGAGCPSPEHATVGRGAGVGAGEGGEGPVRGGVVATAATARSAIVSRAAWGARESPRRHDPEYRSTVKAAFIHHTVQTNRYAPSESAAPGQGRLLLHTNTTGVAMLGTFTSSRPPAAMLSALKRLLAWKLDLTHVDPAGKTILQSAGGANVR